MGGQYYVILPDGQRYGPATVPQLSQWILEGRVLASNSVEDVLTGRQMQVTAVPGIQFPNQNPYSSAPQSPYSQPVQPHQQIPTYNYQQAPQYMPTQYSDGGQSALTWSYVCSIAGFLPVIGLFSPAVGCLTCACVPLGIVGVFLGYTAQNRGHQGAGMAITIGWISMAIAFLSLAVSARGL